MKVLIIDNYDSFTYNLFHQLEHLVEQLDVIRNDELEVEELSSYDKIVLSPGPGLPDEAGKLKEVIQRWATNKSILGVCLGHQAMGEVFACKLRNMSHVKHGVSSELRVVDETDVLYTNLSLPITVGHYHSWVLDENSLGDDWVVTAKTKEGIIMSMRHLKYDLRGVQFHPESVMTPQGRLMLENWLKS